jgi:hypothetical protein
MTTVTRRRQQGKKLVSLAELTKYRRFSIQQYKIHISIQSAKIQTKSMQSSKIQNKSIQNAKIQNKSIQNTAIHIAGNRRQKS